MTLRNYEFITNIRIDYNLKFDFFQFFGIILIGPRGVMDNISIFGIED